jgi:hypothetical protein
LMFSRYFAYAIVKVLRGCSPGECSQVPLCPLTA